MRYLVFSTVLVIALSSIASLSLSNEQLLFKIKNQSMREYRTKYIMILIIQTDQIKKAIQQAIGRLIFKENTMIFYMTNKSLKYPQVKLIHKGKELMNKCISNGALIKDTDLYMSLFSNYDLIENNHQMNITDIKQVNSHNNLKEEDFAFVELILTFTFIVLIIFILLFLIEKFNL